MAVIRPYEDTQDVSSAGLPGRSPERLFAEPGAFGPDTRQAGADFAAASATLQKVQEQNEVSAAYATASTVHSQLLTQMQKDAITSSADPNFSTDQANRANDAFNQAGQQFTTRAGQDAWNRSKAAAQGSLLDAGTQFSIKGAEQQQLGQFQTFVNNQRSIVSQNPAALDTTIQNISQAFNDPNGHFAGVPAAQKTEWMNHVRSDMALSALDGIIRQDPQKAASMLHNGAFDGYIAEGQRWQFDSKINAGLQAQEVAQRQAEAAQRQRDTDAQNKASLDVVKQYTASLAPGAAPFDPKSILNNPGFKTGEAQLGMLEAIKRVQNADQDHQATRNGSAYSTLLTEIGAGHITDVSQLQSYLGRTDGPDLTALGHQQLAALLVGRRDPDTVQETQLRAQLSKTIQSELAGTNAITGLRDPRGEELVGKAMPMVDAAWKAGVDRLTGTGMSKQDAFAHLMNPDDKDYALKGALALKRDPVTFWSDLSKAGNPAQAMPKAPDTGTLTPEQAAAYKSAADVVADFKAGKLSRTDAASVLSSRGWAQ